MSSRFGRFLTGLLAGVSLSLAVPAAGHDYRLRPQKFQRIRRITGYLVGTTDRWNNAKRSEEHDRVKHGLGGYDHG